MPAPIKYDRDVHEIAVQNTLAKAARDVGEAVVWLWITGCSGIVNAFLGNWISVGIYILLFGWFYYSYKKNEPVVRCILAGKFSYPSPVVEKALKDGQEDE